MPRLGSLEFDAGILAALKADRLVVFAGAGVSMGPPSNLDSFATLTDKIARGSGRTPARPFDRFLGELVHQGLSVHARAAEFLTPAGSAPTDLHRHLVRLFGAPERVRLVTTNFDLHFEAAAEDVFGSCPEVYRAPALPLGYEFQGIVHVHGSLPYAAGMVLTDSDFGRAYLTEGWARRFLLDVFRSYTVLFVGYSHDDVVMTYLARALPTGSSVGRYALTETDQNWGLLGITPIRFEKGEGSGAYDALYEGVAKLAERGTRSALDWQARLLELARAAPVDPEATGEVEQALSEAATCRAFVEVARDLTWLSWLDRRGHIDPLFAPGALDVRMRLLCSWVAETYAIDHSHELLGLLASRNLRVNATFWEALGRAIGVEEHKALDTQKLRQWTAVLLASRPDKDDGHVLLWLAERCFEHGLVDASLALFLAMGRHTFELKRGLAWPTDEADEPAAEPLVAACALEADHWVLNEIYEKYVRPEMAKVARPLLSGVIDRLERMHADVAAWAGRDDELDAISYRRSAIEPHDQDDYPEAVDVLVDAARDALEWLAKNDTAQASARVEYLAHAASPILRRLAIHGVAELVGWSADQRIEWAVGRFGLDARAEHHEIHRLIALNYRDATDETRTGLIKAIVAPSVAHVDGAAPGGDAQSSTPQQGGSEAANADEDALRFQFDWLSWLLVAKPDCALAAAALAPILARFPQWRPSEQPDLTHWMGSTGWTGATSPWTVEQLHGQSPGEHLDAWLAFSGERFDGPSRDGLLVAVRDAAKSDAGWGFAVLDTLQLRALWGSDLWSAVLRGMQDAVLTLPQWEQLLTMLANEPLHREHPREIADLLLRLVKGGGEAFAAELLERANQLADRLWAALGTDEEPAFDGNWLTRAINRAGGVVVEYWIAALSIQVQGTEKEARTLPEEYRLRFDRALDGSNTNVGYARALLASQVAFLFRLDEAWARERIIALLRHPDPVVFAQAWHGFLAWGRLYPELADAMLPAFMEAIARAPTDLPTSRSRLIEFYAALCAFHVVDPREQLLPTLFQDGTEEDRAAFARSLGQLMRQFDDAALERLWTGWLRGYWNDRLLGVPAPLTPAECRRMLEWLPHFGTIFPDAVSLAIRMPALPGDERHMLHALREATLGERFPVATARLLIYLANGASVQQADELKVSANRLAGLPVELLSELHEALARAGATIA